MVQFYVLPFFVPPAGRSARSGCCGNCPIYSACFVAWHQSPSQVWRTVYPDYDASRHSQSLAYKSHRYTAAGDPAAVPQAVWSTIRKASKVGHTGYTQHWRSGKFDAFKGWLQASCYTKAQMIEAEAAGWAPYVAVEKLIPGVKVCPHQATGGALRCAHCLLCDGRHGAIQITQHGGAVAMKSWDRIRKEVTV